MDLKKFGLMFSKLREEHEMSQQELSLALGKSSTYINKLENGKINISIKSFLEILNYFDISCKQFFINYSI